MQNPFEFELEQPETYAGYAGEMEQPSHYEALELLESGLGGEVGGGGGGGCTALAVAPLNRAVAANRLFARQLGWACVTGGQVRRPIAQLIALLRGAVPGLAATPTEADLAQAIACWQQTVLGQRGDGQLGPGTWGQMLRRGVLPAPGFKPAAWPVFFGGRRLGILEKIVPYRRCFFDPPAGSPCRPNRSGIANERGGASIEVGFRVTDMDAVRRAGFVDSGGEDMFRWIQVVEFVTVPSTTPPPLFIRRATRVIDPTTLVGAIPDPHPYYWDEVTPAGSDPAFHIANFLDRPSRTLPRLCYDLIFEDVPQFPLTAAQPGRRAYFNFEMALVGVRPGTPTRNVVLNTVLWGFDLVVATGGVDVRLNDLRAGTLGGSRAFRRVVNQATNAGAFPGHCFVGASYTAPARCS